MTPISSPFRTTPLPLLQARWNNLRLKLDGLGLRGLIVTEPHNIGYLTDFSGSTAIALVTVDRVYLLTDFRYLLQVEAESPHCTLVRVAKPGYDPTLAELLGEIGQGGRWGFEAGHITVHRSRRWEELFGPANVSLVPTTDLVEGLRLIKDADEIERIRRAARIASRAIAEIFPRLLDGSRNGLQEAAAAAELDFRMKLLGARNPSFDTILLTGERTALPHGRPSSHTLEADQFLTIDAGASVDGYCSDITRTAVLGNPSDKQKAIWETVREAQEKGLAAIKPGADCVEIDRIARSFIADAGYGDNFGHGLGHGVGRQVHENPRLSPIGEGELRPGMVVTVEPGIYLPDFGGVRLEDLCLVTETGYELLTDAPVQMAYS